MMREAGQSRSGAGIGWWLPVAGCFLLALCTVSAGAGCRKATPAAPAGGPRIVSLAPNITELVCAVGGADCLVGRTEVCNYPPEITGKVPVVGGFGTPSMEILLSMKPTMVLDVALEDESVGRQIEQLGIRRERIKCGTLAEIPSAMISVGRFVGREQQAAVLASNMVSAIAELRKSSQGTNRPTVFAEIWGDPLMTAGKSSFVSEVIEIAGGKNLGDELDKDYCQVSAEWVIGKNPDIILCLGTPTAGAAKEVLLSRVGWDAIKAVKDGRVYDRLNTDVITRPGPRVLDGIAEVKAKISGK